MNELSNHLEIDVNETLSAAPSVCRSERFDHLNSLPYRKSGYFIRSLRSLLDWVKAAAIECASIAILIVLFIMAALCAVDLMDIR